MTTWDFTIAIAALCYIAGAVTVYMVLRRWLLGEVRKPGRTLPYAWARGDVVNVADPDTVTVPRTMSGDGPRANLSFYMHDKSGLGRDVVFPYRTVRKFVMADTPARHEAHIGSNDYSVMLTLAEYYGWVVRDGRGRGVTWFGLMRSRDRRLAELAKWQAGYSIPCSTDSEGGSA